MADWNWWLAALAGRAEPVNEWPPQQGCYRYDNDALIIREAGEQWFAFINADPQPKPAERYWPYVAKKPISKADYMHRRETGEWPAEVGVPKPNGIGHNSGAPPHELAVDAVATLETAFDAWLKEIGGAIASQGHAEKAATFTERLRKLEKESDEKRTAEKAPHLEACRAVDAAWQPVVKGAQAAKKRIEALVAGFVRAENARRQAEAERIRQEQEAERQRRALEEGPGAVIDEAPQIEAAPVVIRSGSGAKHVVRKVKTLKVDDLKAALAYYAAMENVPEDIVAAVKKVAYRQIDAGVAVPGMRIELE